MDPSSAAAISTSVDIAEKSINRIRIQNSRVTDRTSNKRKEKSVNGAIVSTCLRVNLCENHDQKGKLLLSRNYYASI